jgi:hypothetical protein
MDAARGNGETQRRDAGRPIFPRGTTVRDPAAFRGMVASPVPPDHTRRAVLARAISARIASNPRARANYTIRALIRDPAASCGMLAAAIPAAQFFRGILRYARTLGRPRRCSPPRCDVAARERGPHRPGARSARHLGFAAFSRTPPRPATSPAALGRIARLAPLSVPPCPPSLCVLRDICGSFSFRPSVSSL